MLKGHVFSKQLFGNPIFALFVNTFLNGKNGVSNNYKNGMNVTYSGSTLTIDSGAVCIQGRFLEEDTSTTLSAGTDTAFCKLVLEIDLDKQNTESEFNQGSYKIVKSTSNYPSLTQTNIVKNNSGIYQYELARFKTGINGISEFSDRRAFLDFDTIYDEIEQHIQDIDNGSLYLEKSNITVLTGKYTTPEANSGSLIGSIEFNYPTGFTKDNCVVLSLMSKANNGNWSTTGCLNTTASSLGNYNLRASLNDNNIWVGSNKGSDSQSSVTINFKIVLLKLPDVKVSSYELGDVNMDGAVTKEDLTLVQNYINGTEVFTDKQFKLADMNKDGNVSSIDYVQLKNQLGI